MLSTMKNYFIIIRGPAGSGKTTIGKALAGKMRGIYFSFDKILKDHKLDYIPGQPCVPEENCLKGNKLIIPKVLGCYKKGKSAVIEGNFYHKLQIEDLVKRLPKKPFIFTLKANISLCLERDKTRNPLGEEGIKAVHRLVSAFDYGRVIDTDKKTIEGSVNKIISYLPK